MRNVTPFVTRYSLRESQPPTRPCPNLTGPTAKAPGSSTTTSSSYVSVAPADEMVTGLSTIEGVDFAADVPCEGLYAHQTTCPNRRGADLLVRSHTWPSVIAACWTCWDEQGGIRMNCDTRSCVRREQHFRILEVLR